MHDRTRMRRERTTHWIHAATAAALLAMAGALLSGSAAADDDDATAAARPQDPPLTPFTPCPRCKLFLGVGGTFQFWGWSDGLVVPVTFEIDAGRWELGAFRFARTEIAVGYGPPDKTAAEPTWGFSAMRRWQILHPAWGRVYVGFGAAYKLQTDYLSSSRANFSYLVGVRFDLGSHGALLEIATRHWSNAWIKPPNRGVNFLTASVSF
jgi:Lipid A 3-O-deacylase (PagL)